MIVGKLSQPGDECAECGGVGPEYGVTLQYDSDEHQEPDRYHAFCGNCLKVLAEKTASLVRRYEL